MAGPAKPITSSLFGLAAGACALVLVTAILTNAYTSTQVAGDLRDATNQLTAIRKADAEAERARVQRSAKVQRQLDGLRLHAAQQTATERAQRRYLALMARELRSHGIPVPPPPRATVTVGPKAPRRHPGSQGHAAHGPKSPRPSPSPTPCGLIPVLCPFLTLENR